MEITDINQLNPDGTYTYADYLLWKFKERVELFKGKILKMSPAPARIHQDILQNVNQIFYMHFNGNPCKVYFAPFDVRLPRNNGEIITVVQPDLCVVCDLCKLDERGCIGAPDLVVEILSPGNAKKELDLKFSIYEEAGVNEYWIIQPQDRSVFIYTLENGKYIGQKPITEDNVLESKTFPELKFNAKEIFADL